MTTLIWPLILLSIAATMLLLAVCRGNRLKNLLQCLFFALAMAVGASGRAQTNQLPSQMPSVPFSLNFLTNIPTASSFDVAKFALNCGVETKNGSVLNLLKTDAYIRTNWIISVEIQNGAIASVIDNASIYAGYREVWANAEIYAQIGGRRTWVTLAEPPSWQGVFLIGAEWNPFTGGKYCLFGDTAFTTAPTGKVFYQPPGAGFRTGFKWLF